MMDDFGDDWGTANEISDALSCPLGFGTDDEVKLSLVVRKQLQKMVRGLKFRI